MNRLHELDELELVDGEGRVQWLTDVACWFDDDNEPLMHTFRFTIKETEPGFTRLATHDDFILDQLLEYGTEWTDYEVKHP